MRVGVGYSNRQDTDEAGREAVEQALAQANRDDPCDLVLLFSTTSHDPAYLHSVISDSAGGQPVLLGGGAVGAITNRHFGYAEDQVGLAAFWLDGLTYDLLATDSLADHEEERGLELGKTMAGRGVGLDTPILLFYDNINRLHGDLRLNLATPLLQGMEKGLGFLPRRLVGAGLQGDFDALSYSQWLGPHTVSQYVMALTFPERLLVDSVIMHGCRPASDYYTVTRAEKQTILEINGEPALAFLETKITPRLSADHFPFFLILGINRGREGEYNEGSYANRLCLGIDRERNGVVMFESDMVAGTRFQVMYRSLDLDYIPAKINAVFQRQTEAGRQPVFAFYINCAGRADRFHSGVEDAQVVQNTVADRVPLLGIYSGVEIAPIMERPRTLDWTGVFCLFSLPG